MVYFDGKDIDFLADISYYDWCVNNGLLSSPLKCSDMGELLANYSHFIQKIIDYETKLFPSFFQIVETAKDINEE